MKTIIYKSETRGKADYGWLKPSYSFSFSGYYDPTRVHFGMLRVLNDDWVAPGAGFDTHPHDNMEIVTIPLSGALEHRDSMGSGGVIRPGEVQVMSAGTGITHSEFNHSKEEPLTLLQIWVFPNERNVKPRYDQGSYDLKQTRNAFVAVVGPEKGNAPYWIHQDAWFSLGLFDASANVEYTLKNKDHGVYLFVIEGKVDAAGHLLEPRDALGITETDSIPVKVLHEAYLLVIEVPMKQP
jgi:hypothetical protein